MRIGCGEVVENGGCGEWYIGCMWGVGVGVCGTMMWDVGVKVGMVGSG